MIIEPEEDEIFVDNLNRTWVIGCLVTQADRHSLN